MGRNFYTGTEAELASGSTNVVAIVSPSFEDFGLTPSQIASYSSLAESFNAALSLSVTPTTRTPVAIAQKRSLKRQLKTASATLAKLIAATPTVTDAQLMSLHMNVHPNCHTAPRAGGGAGGAGDLGGRAHGDAAHRERFGLADAQLAVWREGARICIRSWGILRRKIRGNIISRK